MSNQPRIPDPEIRARHIAKLSELNRRMDGHILDLDELNAQLEADNQKSPFAAYLKRREQHIALSDKECSL